MHNVENQHNAVFYDAMDDKVVANGEAAPPGRKSSSRAKGPSSMPHPFLPFRPSVPPQLEMERAFSR